MGNLRSKMAGAEATTKSQKSAASMREDYAAKRGRRTSVSAECMSDNAASTFVAPSYDKSEDQKERIKEAVKMNFLFSELDETAKNTIINAMLEKEVKDQENIITQGEEGDFFYVVDSGSFEVIVGGAVVLTYERGGAFGELALMYNCPRAATVRASSDSVVWALDRGTFRHVVLQKTSQRRKKYEAFLEGMQLLDCLTSEQRSKIADVLESVEFEEGEEIITYGDSDRSKMKFYFVEKGSAVAIGADGETVIGQMNEGTYFGEKALLENKPRAASVKSKQGKITCAQLDIAAFERLMGDLQDRMKDRIQSYSKNPAT